MTGSAHGKQYPGPRRFAGIDKPLTATLDSAHGYVLGIQQPVTDHLLAERAAELGAEVRRGREVTGVEQDADGVTVELADGARLRSRWLVGCDGGRSLVRRLLGVGFPGEPAQTEWLLAEIEVTTPPDELTAVADEVRKTHKGFGSAPQATGCTVPSCPPRPWPRTARRRRPWRSSGAAAGLRGHGLRRPLARWLSRFTDATRLAERYRTGRVFLAGDAAHVHPPLGDRGSTSASRTRSTSAGSSPPR